MLCIIKLANSATKFTNLNVKRILFDHNKKNQYIYLNHSNLHSTQNKQKIEQFTITKPCVFYSPYFNIYENLALEHWIYKRVDFQENGRLLMLWSNRPCIVIGRHQNIFAECDSSCSERGIDIARRYSGGGTVYHDLGTLCATFFTSRTQYNRKENLNLLLDFLNKFEGSRSKVKFEMNDRDDLRMNGFKISGTAAKLGRNSAYHHLTLLVDTDLQKLDEYLTSPFVGKNYTVEQVMVELERSYSNKYSPGQTIDTLPLSKMMKEDDWQQEMRRLTSWDTVYAFTPKFSVIHKSKASEIGQLFIDLEVTKGRISSSKVQLLNGSGSNHHAVELLRDLLNKKSDDLETIRYHRKDVSLVVEQIASLDAGMGSLVSDAFSELNVDVL